MSRLDELIAQYCPDGVEYKKLEEVLKIKNGSDYKHLASGTIPVYGSGGIIAYVDTPAYNEPTVLIPRKGSLDKLYFVETPFWNVDTIFYTEIMTNIANPKYVYYVLQKEHLEKYNTAGGVPSLTQNVLNKITIPVPPLPVQQEIVRVLDTFTNYLSELHTELQIRNKQFEIYRDKIIFESNCPLVELRSVVKKYSTGATPKKENSAFYDDGHIPWIRTQDVRFNEITEVESYITELAVEQTSAKWIPENCVIVAISGASAGRCAINKFKATTNQHCLNMEIDPTIALYKYVYFCVCGRYKELLARKQGARGDLNSSLILSITIPLPPIAEQAKILSTLNIFDSLVASYSYGLPAEIEARQKQYEYYRDKLLTFKQKSHE